MVRFTIRLLGMIDDLAAMFPDATMDMRLGQPVGMWRPVSAYDCEANLCRV
jgi:hypothetical protein